MQNKATVRINVEKLKELIVLSSRYNFLRNQDDDSVDNMGSFAPYVIQGQTANWLYGEELDRTIDRELSTTEWADAEARMYEMIELDMLGNPE